MKRLALLRHAKTERDSSSGRDFDRQLTERGLNDGRKLGRELRRLEVSFDLVLSSPAKRAVETIEAVGMAANLDPRIYDGSAGDLLSIIQETDDAISSLMLVGHNPGFEYLASRLTGGHVGMRTGTIIEIEFPIDRWENVGAGIGRMLRNIRGKDLG